MYFQYFSINFCTDIILPIPYLKMIWLVVTWSMSLLAFQGSSDFEIPKSHASNTLHRIDCYSTKMSPFTGFIKFLKKQTYSRETCDGQHGNNQLNYSKITRIGIIFWSSWYISENIYESSSPNILRRDSEWAVTEAVGVYLVKRLKTLYQYAFF